MQGRRLQAFQPWIETLDIEASVPVHAPHNVLGKMSAGASERMRKHGEAKALKDRGKAEEKYWEEVGKIQEGYQKEMAKAERKGDDHERDKASRKHQEEMSKAEHDRLKDDKEEEVMHKIFWLVIYSVDIDHQTEESYPVAEHHMDHYDEVMEPLRKLSGVCGILQWGIIVILPIHDGLGPHLTSAIIESMANNSLFERWRPYSHFIAPAGWMNDPCGPMYDPVKDQYHMHYQWHPFHVEWGNISWGHATSRDMVIWTDVDHSPNNGIPAWSDTQAESIAPSQLTTNHHQPPKYNSLGIFSGTAQPVNLSGQVDGTLLAFYTSVAHLPTSWDATYLPGTESQSLAYSTDGGLTWLEYGGNPVISQPPPGWNVTGFRDPFFQASPAFDVLLNQTEPQYYCIFGASIGDVGPRIPLYSAPTSDLTNWTYLGALWEPQGNSTPGKLEEVGTWGWNFEVPNLFELEGHYFVSTGVQGGSTGFAEQNWVTWSEGLITARSNRSIAFEPVSKGAVDYGLLYAVTSFNDTKGNRRLQIGWAQEDMNEFGIVQQGFQGSLSIPRELFILNTPNVVPPAVMGISSSVYTLQPNGTYTGRTLGSRPAPDIIQGLRNGSTQTTHAITNLAGQGDGPRSQILLPSTSSSYEISFTILTTTGRTGLTLASSPDCQEYTTLAYDPATSTISISRTHSSLNTKFPNTTHTGFFQPYNISSSSPPSSNPEPEPITITLIHDGSLLELFVNDRFSLTSRIYPSRLDSTGLGLFAEPGVSVQYSGEITVWDGLRNIWPERPRNSSGRLVFDSAVESGNHTWWTGL